MRRGVQIRSVALAVALALVLGSVAVPTVQAADVSLIFTMIKEIKERYYKPTATVALLNGALNGLRGALTRAGITPQALDDMDISTPIADAEAQFTNKFNSAVQQGAGKISADDLVFAAARGLAASLNDSHVFFVPPAPPSPDPGTPAGGLGVLIRRFDTRVFVFEVVPGSGAARAGVQRFDEIVAISGEQVASLSAADFSARARGPVGSTVVITVRRPGQQATLDLTITRAVIPTVTVSSRMLEGSIGYIKIWDFGTWDGYSDTRNALGGAARGRALILDLRYNPGGFVREVIKTAELFFPVDTPVMRLRQLGQISVFRTESGVQAVPSSLPIYILVNEGSGSGAEVTAALFQETKRATIVGKKSAGAVLVANSVPLPFGARMSITVAEFFTPQGKVLEGVGVIPDVEVDLTLDDFVAGRDAQLQKAIELASGAR